jgi:hypothetical protein
MASEFQTLLFDIEQLASYLKMTEDRDGQTVSRADYDQMYNTHYIFEGNAMAGTAQVITYNFPRSRIRRLAPQEMFRRDVDDIDTLKKIKAKLRWQAVEQAKVDVVRELAEKRIKDMLERK